MTAPMGRLQNPLAQNDVRAGEPSRRWEARWNKWNGQERTVDQITARWPAIEIVLRAYAAFAFTPVSLMAWYEDNAAD